MDAPETVIELVERFARQRDAYRSGDYNEARLRREFLDPFFGALGWDMDNKRGYAEPYKDVVHEDSIKVGGGTKAPDYCFRIGGTRKFFVEAKKPAVNIKEDVHPAYQLRRYAWTAKLPLSIVTDFEEFAVYDCRVRPHAEDKASTARTMYLKRMLVECRQPGRRCRSAVTSRRAEVLTGSAALFLVLAACSRGRSSPATDAGTAAPPSPVSSSTLSASSHELVSAAAAVPTAAVPGGYSRRRTFPVTKGPNGVDGVVELLEDERIRSEQLPKRGQLRGDPCKSLADFPTPPFCKALKMPLQPARIRLAASDGRELSTLTMERPLARLDVVYLRSEVPSYQVTVDLTAEFGSYSGPTTRFAEVRNGTLGWLIAVDVQTGKSIEVAVASTLKTEWKLSPMTSGGKEVLQIACRPDFGDPHSDAGMGFLITLSRFAFENGRWQRHTRVTKGFWENDNAFPARTQFP